MLESCIAVPTRTLNRFRQSRHRNGMVLCFAPVWTFTLPQCGQAGSLPQRHSVSHLSAAASSGNLRKTSISDSPSRWLLPGPVLLAILFSPLLLPGLADTLNIESKQAICKGNLGTIRYNPHCLYLAVTVAMSGTPQGSARPRPWSHRCRACRPMRSGRKPGSS